MYRLYQNVKNIKNINSKNDILKYKKTSVNWFLKNQNKLFNCFSTDLIVKIFKS